MPLTHERPTVSHPVPTQPRGRTTGRVVGAVVGGLLLVLGLGSMVAGAGVAATSVALRDDDGFWRTTTTTWYSPGFAVRSDDLDLSGGPLRWDVPARMLGEVRVTARATNGGVVFLGVAPTEDAQDYLRGVAASTMVDPWAEGGPRTTLVSGGAPTARPADAPIWVASAAGPGAQTVAWEPRTGHWTLVVMNADAGQTVSADVVLAAEAPAVDTLAVGLVLVGLVVLGAGGIGLWLAVPRRAIPTPPGGTP